MFPAFAKRHKPSDHNPQVNFIFRLRKIANDRSAESLLYNEDAGRKGKLWFVKNIGRLKIQSVITCSEIEYLRAIGSRGKRRDDLGCIIDAVGDVRIYGCA